MTSLTPAQNRLASANYEWALRVARPFAARYPRHADNVESAALYGLVLAAGKFDTGRGFAFRTFAERCIRGHIKNSLLESVAKGFRDDPGSAPRVTSLDAHANDGSLDDYLAVEADGEAVDEEDQFEALISVLPDSQRELLRLVFLADRSIVGAAEVLRIPLALASLRYAAAIKRLGGRLQRLHIGAEAFSARAC